MRDGAADSFRRVVGEHGAMLRRIAASYEADPALREELGQEMLMAVWRALPGFRAESSVKTFIARVAHNRAIDHVARRAAAPRSAALDEGWASDAPSPLETRNGGTRGSVWSERCTACPCRSDR